MHNGAISETSIQLDAVEDSIRFERASSTSPSSPAQNGNPALHDPRLSVIIPTLNEERALGPVLDLLRCSGVWEVIVADGESADQTLRVAHSFGATVVNSKPGRGIQMNAGAAAASGNMLLFLHADTLLPAGFQSHVFKTLSNPNVSAGAFRLAIDAPRRSLRLVEKMVHYRSRFLQCPYGDQALFTRADTFEQVGGFPDWPIMEDIDLTRRLRRAGRIEIAPASVVTSARRWLKQGVWRTALKNHACIAAYRLGVSPMRIDRWRNPRTIN